MPNNPPAMKSLFTRAVPPIVGALLSIAPFHLFGVDYSKPVALSETPPMVQKTVAAQIAGGTLAGISQSSENGKTSFDVSFTTKAGESHGFTVGSDGTVLSVEVPLAGTPAAVQKTIQAQAGGWDVEGIDKSVSDGKFSYDVEITKDGVEKSFTVDDDGTLSSIEVALADTPPAVQKTIQAQAAGWDVTGIDKSTEDLETSYDVQVAKDGQEKNFTVDDDGTLSSIEVALSDTPVPVQKTLQLQASGWEVESIDKATDDSGATYDIEVSKGGVKRNFTIADDGYFESMEVSLADTQLPVKEAIQKQLAGGSVKSIDENFDPAGNSFDVVATGADGSRKSFSIGADGSLVSQEVTLADTTPLAHATIMNQLGGDTLKSIDESFDPPVTTYDIAVVTKDGDKRNFTVGSGGWMRSEEVTLDQTSPAAHATIQNQVGDGKIIRIDKAWAEKKEDGVVPFEVQARKGGQPFNFSVGPKGKFLGMDQ